MRFDWKDYVPDTTSFVEDWIDDNAVRMTGLDDGWLAFHKDCIAEIAATPGEEYWCKVVYENDAPFAVIAFSRYDENCSIMEFLVKPDMRGMGLGTALLRELLSSGETISGHRIEKATAVIFPNNPASQKAFENAGFAFDHAHEDGDVWYYVYNPNHLSDPFASWN